MFYYKRLPNDEWEKLLEINLMYDLLFLIIILNIVSRCDVIFYFEKLNKQFFFIIIFHKNDFIH